MWNVTAPRVIIQPGATFTKGPDHEILACESTTLPCNPHLEEKPIVGKPACEI